MFARCILLAYAWPALALQKDGLSDRGFHQMSATNDSIDTFDGQFEEDPFAEEEDEYYEDPNWMSDLANRELLDRNQSEPGRDNLCKNGHLIPEFYLLGLQKSATTSWAAFFYQSPSIAATRKESHIFDKQEEFRKAGGEQGWMQNYPACEKDVRFIAADSTPMEESQFAARTLRREYGSLQTRIQFAVILRGPIERMFSAYYMGQEKGWAGGALNKYSFQEVSDQVIAGQEYNIAMRSKYAPHLRMWFYYFSSSQFFFMMMKDAISDEAMSGSSRLMHRLWGKLHLQIPRWYATSHHIFNRKHPSLLDQINSSTFAELRNYFEPWSSPENVAHVLHHSEAELWDCNCSTKAAMIDWIHYRW